METLLDSPGLPAPSSTVLDRLRYLLELSRRTQAHFSRMVGVDPSTMSKILSGRFVVTDSFLNKVVVNLGVSKAWLAEGKGVPFPRVQSPEKVETEEVAVVQAPVGAPVYDIDVTAGVTPLSQMFTQDRIIGYMDMPDLDARYPVVRVNGDSMKPDVPDGALVSIREITDASVIAWGATYVVQLADYRMVKVIRRHSDPHKIILHSVNPEYDDIEVDRSKVLNLYLVVKIITCRTLI